MPLAAGVRWSFRGKDAGSVDSSAIGATEDAASGRAARPGGSDVGPSSPPQRQEEQTDSARPKWSRRPIEVPQLRQSTPECCMANARKSL